jgi:hypothetical protein
MGKPMQDICEDVLPDYALAMAKGPVAASPLQDVELVLPHESMKTWSAEKRAAFLEGVRLILSVGGKVRIVDETVGSVKITLRLTAEQADELRAAQADGRLAALGVSEVRSVTARPLLLRRINRPAVLGVISLICGLAGVVPWWSPPAYLVGLASGVAGLLLARRYKVRNVLPIAGVVLNVVALAAWPLAVGVFQTERGYRLGYGDRAQTQKPLRFMIIPEDRPFDNPLVGEEAVIRVDGTPVCRLIGVATGDAARPIQFRDLQASADSREVKFAVPFGRHELTVERGGRITGRLVYDSPATGGDVPVAFPQEN